MSDILQWDHSNKNYILTHGVAGVDWADYKTSSSRARVRRLYAILGRRDSRHRETKRSLSHLRGVIIMFLSSDD